MPRLRLVTAALALAVAAPSTAAAAPSPRATAAAKIVVKGKLQDFKWPTARYASRRGDFTARWLSSKRYKLSGRIDGKRLTGTIRTVRGAKRYVASGSGRLGGRTVRISGGGPNSLKTATLVLR